jgi:hypothetical protein
MKLRGDLENRILKTVLRKIDGFIHRSIDFGIKLEDISEPDLWFDVYDQIDNTKYTVNVFWGYPSKEDPFKSSFSVTVYPLEKYQNEFGETHYRDITDGNSVVLVGNDWEKE